MMVANAIQTYVNIYAPQTALQITKVYKDAINAGSLQYQSSGMMNLFEFQGGGWILMSNDCNAQPVLAYSKSGSWNPDTSQMPPGLVELLCDYINQIAEIKLETQGKASSANPSYQENQAKWQGLQNMNTSYVRSLISAKNTEVPNLLVDEQGQEVRWDQAVQHEELLTRTYNKFAPKKDEFVLGCVGGRWECKDGTNRKPVGCSSVAMGQLMWYWQFPPQYDWDRMPPVLYSITSIQEENNIAHLLKTCGDMAEVTYCCPGSWTTTNKVVSAMKNMHFPESNKKRRGDNDDGKWWPDLIKEQLNRGWPVIYRGDKCDLCTDKHLWVISGYNSDGLFYCNWGWGREEDDTQNNVNGFYNLRSLKPNKVNYRKNNMVIRDIYPDWTNTNDWRGVNIVKGNDEELRMFCSNAYLNNITLQGNSQSKIAFTGELTIDGPMTVTGGATLTLACYDKELAKQLANMPVAKTPETQNDSPYANTNESAETIPDNKATDLFILYPNPASQEVSVSMAPFAADVSKKDVYLYNAQGKLCLQTQFHDSYCTIALPDLHPGMYIVKVVTPQYEMNKKLILQ